MQQPFDRAAEDLGNSIHLEHVNVQVPDQRLATLFYVTGLGLTRDPYLMVSDTNMWINVGRSQFHLPSGKAQVLRGHTGIVIAGREALLDRLASVAKKLDGTAFAFSEHNDYVEATCPWGNRVRCYEPDAARFGRITLGIPYVEFDVPVGTAKGICAFYPEIMGMPAELENGDGTVARVKVGKDQYLQFRETDRPQPDYDGHHVQIYITNFSGPYRRLSERNLISQRGQSIPVPLSRHRRPRQRQAPVHGRARGAQRHPPDVPAAAGQPQSGADQPQLRARPRRNGPGRWDRTSTTDDRDGSHPCRPCERRDPYAVSLILRDAVRRLSFDN